MAYQDYSWTSRSAGGTQYYEPNWSSFMNNYNIGGRDNGSNATRTYSWNVYFNNYGKQKFWTAVDDYGYVWINGAYQFSMGGFNSQTSRTTPGYFAPGTYTISASTVNSGGGPWGVALDWYGYDPPPPPSINSFYASPNPQYSSGGSPAYNSTLTWSATSQTSVSGNITGPNYSVNISGTSGSVDVNNLPQSTVGSNSPAQASYTITLYNNGGSGSTSTTISVYNDNILSNFNTWTNSFGNLEPNTQYALSLGTIQGVDMPIVVSSGAAATNFGTNNGVWGNPRTFTNGQTVFMQTTTLPFNTVVDTNGLFGNNNTKTVPVTVGGSGVYNVSVVTKAPRISEDFDISDVVNQLPNPDIDVIPGSPNTYITTGNISIDDIEVAAEVKTNQADAQINVNGSGWQNMREI